MVLICRNALVVLTKLDVVDTKVYEKRRLYAIAWRRKICNAVSG